MVSPGGERPAGSAAAPGADTVLRHRLLDVVQPELDAA
jgi:hypothetical protein